MAKILLVEDEKILTDLLRHKLEKEGYEISIAMSKEEGIEKMKREWPDLAIIDLDMAQREGLKMMEEIGKRPELKSMPIIVMADSNESPALIKARALGADDWLVKTAFEPKELLKKIRKQIVR